MKRVIVHIDRLALVGIRPEDRHGLAAGLQQALGGVFADGAAAGQLTAAGDTPRLQIGHVMVERGASPRRIGQRIAQGIGKDIGK